MDFKLAVAKLFNELEDALSSLQKKIADVFYDYFPQQEEEDTAMSDPVDPGEQPTGPSEQQVADWTAAIHEIMERDGVTEEQANAGLVAVLLSPEVQEQIKEIEADAEAQRTRDVALWTSVIQSLQAQFPQWTEQECNDNLANLLEWVKAHPEG